MRPGTVAEVIVQCLVNAGVEVVFGVPGGPLTPFYQALAHDGRIRAVLAKHEAGAAYMANGYARASGRLGVCCTTSGPGASNALTAIACAKADSVPVLLLTAQVATRNFGHGAAQDGSPQGIDIVQIYKAATKSSSMLSHPDRAQGWVENAIQLALGGRQGPVHLSLPVDIARVISVYQVAPTRALPSSGLPDRTAIAAIVSGLLNAKRACLLVGRGCLSPDAMTALAAFAQWTQIPVLTTPKAKGAISDDHPLAMGVLGLAGSDIATRYFQHPDLEAIWVIGSSLGETVCYEWPKALAARIFQVDIDATEIGKNYPVALGLQADAAKALNAALEFLQESGGLGRTMSGTTLESKRNLQRIDPSIIDMAYAPISPIVMMSVLSSAFPANALLLVDIGNCMLWSGHYFRVLEPGSYHINLGFGAMGHAVAAAVGAQWAMATKGRVVALCGDAAFAMHGMELHTAVEYALPAIWIVMNNAGHGMVAHGEQALCGGMVSPSVFRRRIDFARLAQSCGALGFTVESGKQLIEALEMAIASQKPAVIDVLIDNAVSPPGLAQRAQLLGSKNNATPGLPQ